IRPRFLPSRVSNGAASHPRRAASWFLGMARHGRLDSFDVVSRTGLPRVQASMNISELAWGNSKAGSPSAAETHVTLRVHEALANSVVNACRAPMILLA